MIKGSPGFNQGDLVTLCVINKSVTKEGLTTLGFYPTHDTAILYEKIDINSYPSANDFFGKMRTVKDGTRGIIIKKIGRPIQIMTSKIWSKYDVYEVLFDGETCQVFSYNLKHVKNEEDPKSS